MSMRETFRSPAVRASLAALVAALGLLAWTTTHAFRVEALPDAPQTMVASLDSIGRHGVRAPADVESAVEHDVFAPDRSAPGAPYRMPGEALASSAPVAESPKPAVLGTVVATDGRSFATLQLGTDQPKLAHVGDKVGDWVVRSIQRGKVVLVSTAGTRAELTVPKPGT